jgi:predicted TIM-barrel fold metal-dependent hydrolase
VQFQAFDAKRRIWDLAWEPLWSAAEETGVPISFHQGGGLWSDAGIDIPPGRGVELVRITVVAAQLDEVLAALVLSGVLERHPKFRAVLGESSLGWIPYILEKMDQEYDMRPRLRPIDTPKLKLKPSEYYQRQMYATFQEDHVGLKLLRSWGRTPSCGPQTIPTVIPYGRIPTKSSTGTWLVWTRPLYAR